MRRIFGFGFDNILFMNRAKLRIIFSTIILVVILNISLSISLNLKNLKDDSLSNTFLVVDLQGNLKDKKNELEKEILKLNGINSVRFIDKSESFKNLQNELNISIPESSNPLDDSIIVYLKDKNYISGIQEKLESMEEVKEVYKDDNFLGTNEKTFFNLFVFEVASLVVAVLIGLIVLIIFNLNIIIDFLNMCNIKREHIKSLGIAKKDNFLTFFLSTIAAYLIFLNLYFLFNKYCFVKEFDFVLLSLKEILLWNSLAIIILNILAFLLPASIFSVDRLGDSDDDEDEI